MTDPFKLIIKDTKETTDLFISILTYELKSDPNIIHKRNEFNNTFLHVAVYYGNLEIVEFLLKQKNIDVNCVCNKTVTPIVNAGAFSRKNELPKIDNIIEIIKLSNMSGANINYKKVNGQTVLHCAKYPEITKVLLECGADMNILDNDGCTPLDVALLNKRYDVAKVLINSGSDISKINTKNIEFPKDSFEEKTIGDTIDYLKKSLILQLCNKN